MALGAAAPAAAAPQTRPNIVLLVTDDQTQQSLRFMLRTNALLAQNGTVFQRAFASFPLCCPSRATFLTGQYAHNHGVLHNSGRLGGYPRLDHANALPVWLQAEGYRTIQLGRYLNGYGTSVPGTTIPPGWSDWHAAVDPSTFNYVRWTMNENGRLEEQFGEHQTDYYGRRAAELIEQAAPSEQPFFLSVWFAAPHSGAPRDPDDPEELRTPSPPARYRDAFAAEPLPRPPSFDSADVSTKPLVVADRDRLTPGEQGAIEENYRQELESLLAVDDAVAAVVDALDGAGELGRTLIVLTSDNGFMHGEHRFLAGKVLPYEPSIRVPLVMRGPGVPSGRRERRLVANVDVAPTILDAANTPAGRVQDGRSLLRLLADHRREWGREVLLENGFGAAGVGAYRGIRNQRFVYVEHRSTGEVELYDLRRDPHQLRNLDGRRAYRALQEQLGRRLRRLRRCRGRSCRLPPRLRMLTRAPTRPARRRARCVAGDVRVRLSGADRSWLAAMELFLGRRRVARERRAPFVTRVPFGALRRGRQQRLRARAVLRDGRTLTLDRALLVCR